MDALRQLYREQHRPLASLSATARRLHALIAQAPCNNAELKLLSGLEGKSRKYEYDKALKELQVAFQIVRINRVDTDGDTWTPFEAQYPGIVDI